MGDGHRDESVIDSTFARPVAKEMDNYSRVLQELRKRKLGVCVPGAPLSPSYPAYVRRHGRGGF